MHRPSLHTSILSVRAAVDRVRELSKSNSADPSCSFLGYVGREFSTILTDNNYHFTEVVNKTQASGKMNKLQRMLLEVLVALSSLARRW
jgi:hypothetical protein